MVGMISKLHFVFFGVVVGDVSSGICQSFGSADYVFAAGVCV